MKGYTTTVPADRTAGEVQAMLARGGATAVMIAYDAGTPTGVRFTLTTPAGSQGFAMPINVDGVAAALVKHEREGLISLRPNQRTRAHAERVAWRIARDWLDAQLALVAAGLATIDETMLPYLLTATDETLYQSFAARGLRELTAGAAGG